MNKFHPTQIPHASLDLLTTIEVPRTNGVYFNQPLVHFIHALTKMLDPSSEKGVH